MPATAAAGICSVVAIAALQHNLISQSCLALVDFVTSIMNEDTILIRHSWNLVDNPDLSYANN